MPPGPEAKALARLAPAEPVPGPDLADNERRLAEMVLRAAAIETGERDAYLRQAANDSRLLAEARRRLASAEDLASSFLAEPLGRLFETPVPRSQAQPWEAEPAGKIIGPYRLESLLGRGGMGAVYKAQDESQGRFVAIKHIRSEAAGDSDRRERFWREARALAQLGHPAIVRILDFLEVDGAGWIVMELVDGPTLAEILRDGPVDVEAALGYGQQIAAALAAAHDQGIVHRDLKTENVMLCPVRGDTLPASGLIKVLDFGLAHRFSEDDPSLSTPGQILGTPRAMSPEQTLGREIDARSDLFSFGVLLYELLTTHSPFLAGSPYQILDRVRTHHPRPVQRLDPRIPRRLSDLVGQLLEKDPARRGDGAAAVARALAELSPNATPVYAPLTSVASGRVQRASLRTWPPPRLPSEPYPVLLPYSHPALLAGRDSEITRLRDCLRMSQPVLGLHGPSGTGKSSLLLGGLVPLLRAEGRPVAVVRHPLEAGVAGRLLGDLLADEKPIAEGDGRGFLERLQEVERLAAQPAVLVIDQFEDVLKPGADSSRLGALLAATIGPDDGAVPCRWLLAYRQEFHGAVEVWLRDVLQQRSAERFHSVPLSPLATPSGSLSGEAWLEEATETFLEAIEKPLALCREDGTRLYPWRFAAGQAERLARAFAQARVDQPEAPLVPELQVVLARLLASTSVVELPADPGALIAEALDDHLRRALRVAFPIGLDGGAKSGARISRTRALLALYELTGQLERGLGVEDLAEVIGENGTEVLEQLATPLNRLVVLQQRPEGPRYVLAHDRMAEAVACLVEEEGRQGELLVDAELLALRRFVALKTALHRSREKAATRLPRRHFRQIGEHAEALVWNQEGRTWWAACHQRRKNDRRRIAGVSAAMAIFLALVVWGVWSQARQWRQHRAHLEQVVEGEPEVALRTLVRLSGEGQADDELLALLRQRKDTMDVLGLGLGAFEGEQRSAVVLRVVEIALPWVDETPDDPGLIANLAWALDFGPGRDPSHARQALSLRDRILEPLRQLRPLGRFRPLGRLRPPPAVEDPDWIEVPAGTFHMGSGPEVEEEEERPTHEVTVSAFHMLRHEVTNADYRFLVPDHAGEDKLPASGITWTQAYTYAAWLGGRLPTEAEWEYAARAGCPYTYCDRRGHEVMADEVAWTQLTSLGQETGSFELAPVMQLEPNPWGLYDTLGSLWEWTADWDDGDFSTLARRDPWGSTRSSRNGRVLRGGAFMSMDDMARVGRRHRMPPRSNNSETGFRIVFPASHGNTTRKPVLR